MDMITVDMVTKEQLQNYLVEILPNLYDPNRLRTTPLVTLLNAADTTDTPTALRDSLLDAIEALKPMRETSSTSNVGASHSSTVWRIYDILFYSYVQQFSRQEVADQIGLSTRHLRREHRTAMDALVEYLWEKFNLGQRTDASVEQSQESSATIDRELSWVKELSPKDPVNLNQALSSVVELIGNLVEHYEVALQINVTRSLPDLAVHPTALRQVLISLLTMAIHRCAGGTINIFIESFQMETIQMETIVHIDGTPANVPVKTNPNADDTIGLEIAQSLVDIWGGGLTLRSDLPGFHATMTLPALACVPVLVIDDNVDTLHLLQRYASGSRYRIFGTQDPREALQLAQGISPQIIVTDVMMPELDGWELLGQLRQHPLTARIPIVICTILPQQELALSVGADGFIQKPVSRVRFLSMLDQQVNQVAEVAHKRYE